ncbi:hypothetical protein BurJ1DRAFT_4538 [Burkholderiales bacterium JOSHI_001]|nr:hypothetical protein BurJ1DRAFT_4538 [Burkholderiales bacterium JOSHI_001]
MLQPRILSALARAPRPARWAARWALALALPLLLALPPWQAGVAAEAAAAPAPALDPAAARPSCPPPPAMPTPEQMAAAQRDARDHGLLWRIRRGGHDSYLYGTLHVGKLDWSMPGPKLAAAVRATDTLALELDITDASLMQALMISSDERPAPPLPEALAQRLARQRAAACVPDGGLDRLHPLLQSMSLAVLAARWEGLDPAYAQELVLAGAAHTLRRPIVSLETVQTQRDALIPREPEAVLKALEDALTQLENLRARATIRRLSLAWAQSDLADLERYPQWCDCTNTESDRAMMRRLLDDRNTGLAERIDAMHGQGQRVLAAVGALHMVGPKGLPALLQQRGYQVQRLLPAQN